MKKILFFSLLIVCFLANAQLTQVKTMTFGTTTLPKQYVFPQHSTWNNKVFYQSGGADCSTCSTTALYLSVTDGTDSGTLNLKNLLTTEVYDAKIYQFKQGLNYLYFTVKFQNRTTGRYTYQLWRTTGTADGTVKIDEVAEYNSTAAIPINIGGLEDGNNYVTNKKTNYLGNTFFYTKKNPNNTNPYSMLLYKTNGDSGDAVAVSTTQILYTTANAYNNLLAYEGFIYFINSSYALCKTDGITVTTVLSNIIGRSANNGYLGTVYKNRLYFLGDLNSKLGIYSISAQNTTPVEHYILPSNLVAPDQIGKSFMVHFSSTDKVLFFADLQNTFKKIYALNVENNNLKTVFDDPEFAFANWVTDNNQAYIIAKSTKNNNIKIVRINSDASDIQSFSPGTSGSIQNTEVAVYRNTLWFPYLNKSDPNAIMNSEVWRSNASAETTSEAFNINRTMMGNYLQGSSPKNYFILNDELYFFAMYDSGKYALYKFKGDFTYNNSVGDNNWNNKDNWNSTLTPLLYNDATIPVAFTPQITGSAFAENLSMSSPLNLTSGSFNVSGNLNLNAKVTLNNNSLILKGSAAQITNGNSTNYIVTNGTGTVNVENLNAERGIVNLPIGTATNYNPVSISNTGTSDTFSARVSDGIANTTNGAVNATWDISEATAGGSNVSLTLGWNTSQQNGSFDASTAKVGHYLNGSWTPENSGAVSNNFITATGISSFSPFAMMNFGTLAATDFSKSKVSVYPNPFNENLNISTENGGVVYFYDLSGKLFSTSVLMKGTNSLNKSSLAKGVYIYQIKNASGEVVSSGKVIKN